MKTEDRIAELPPAYPPTRAGSLVAGGLALLIAIVAFAAVIGVGERRVTGFEMERIVREAPTPDPRALAEGCPQLTNPGGKLDWTPRPDSRATPTNGTVAIPALGKQAPIVRVGIDYTNRMVVPTNARDVGWLDQGGIPGRTNNVVLAGHIEYSRVAGTFNQLDRMAVGDDIFLTIDNKALHYRVVWSCQFARDTDLAEQIMGYTNTPSVTLITCGGVFDTSAGTRTHRRVVRAELVTRSEPGVTGAQSKVSGV